MWYDVMFSCSVQLSASRSNPQTPGISTGDVAKKNKKLGEMWNLSDHEKQLQLYVSKVMKLKEKYEKDAADY
jgi:hypothetical protein